MRYMRLLIKLFRYNAAREVEFRANFLILTLVDVIWVVLQIVLIELLFGFTDHIGTWSKAEVLILMGLFRIVKGLFALLFRPNLFQLPILVNREELDKILTKPIESQFLVSLNRVDLAEWAEIVLGGFILFYGLTLPWATCVNLLPRTTRCISDAWPRLVLQRDVYLLDTITVYPAFNGSGRVLRHTISCLEIPN